MGEVPKNEPLSPRECVDVAVRQVDHYIWLGGCTACALRMVAKEYQLDPDKLRSLYMDHVFTELYDPED